MANTNAPFGLRPIRTLGGASYDGTYRKYSVAAGNGTAIYVGDPVMQTGVGTGQTINGETLPDVVKAGATTDIITGVVVGVEMVTRDSLPYRAASTQRVLYVCDDPNMLFLVQEANSGTALTANDLGANVSLTLTAGSAVTGLSGTVIDNTAAGTTNTLIAKLVEFDNAPDNEVGSVAQRWIVRLNRHRMIDQQTGV
jgi:hypothetical protein